MKSGDWAYSEYYQEFCRLIDVQKVWGTTSVLAWLPSHNQVVRLDSAGLKNTQEAGKLHASRIAYIVSAARVSNALTQDVLLAPLGADLLPLPHQIRALSRAISGHRIRYLLADEVGLGKTIEAGLILRELKLRGQVRRILIVVPKGLVRQWIAELRTRFNEDFRLLIPADFSDYRHIAKEENIWRACDQVITPLDTVKPIDSRKGWTDEEVAEYNRERFEDLVSAGWDLIIIDEAHRMGGTSDQVARHKLGKGLSQAAPFLLLLSGTPHQGKTDAFHRILTLLDKQAFPTAEAVVRERVQPYVIRTAKRSAIDAEGKPLFKPRETKTLPITWAKKHQGQKTLYEAVTNYVRLGYNQAMREKKTYVGFLLLLMQRLVASSTSAILTSLERRLEVLREPEEQLSFFGRFDQEEWNDLDGQQQLDKLLSIKLTALKNERTEVELLLETARRTMATGPDAKAEALINLIYQLQQEEGDPNLKALVFTEFVPTQDMLYDFFSDRGFTVAKLNGSMDLDERKQAQDAFKGDARILISTEAGGEGLNLQFCHVVINYDLPWNPMRIEQRIGRVDRIGQEHIVRAYNLIFQDTVEYRVREVLEQKLRVILEQFGVDKTGDVLDSASAERIFDDLYKDALLDPDSIETKVDAAINKLREEAGTYRENMRLIPGEENLDPTEARNVLNHPLPYWLEKMTVSYLLSGSGAAKQLDGAWELRWPDGFIHKGVTFVPQQAALRGSMLLTLEEPRVRGLVIGLPRFAPGQPVPAIKVQGLPAEVKGWWSLWQVTLITEESSQRRAMPVFLHEDGRTLQPTARFVWDRLLETTLEPQAYLDDKISQRIYDRSRTVAEEQGSALYLELTQVHHNRMAGEKEKGQFSFTERRRLLGRIGLPSVREHRLKKLEGEEREWKQQMNKLDLATPELAPLIIIQVEAV
jgi:superfamily II DNA or RNA helicase